MSNTIQVKPGKSIQKTGITKRSEIPDPIAFNTNNASTSALVSSGIDLNVHLIEHPAATFFMRMEGEAMIDANIRSGDILIVDRAVPAKHKCIVVAVVDGEFLVRRYMQTSPESPTMPFLIAEHPGYKPNKLSREESPNIWGVVRYIIHAAV